MFDILSPSFNPEWTSMNIGATFQA